MATAVPARPTQYGRVYTQVQGKPWQTPNKWVFLGLKLIVSAAQRKALNNFAVTGPPAWIRVRSSKKSSQRENLVYEVPWLHRNLAQATFFTFPPPRVFN